MRCLFLTVVMAKGIGNGFPLAAVATTPEIAETMGKALHFNTFGGNPIACSVGSAVLDVSLTIWLCHAQTCFWGYAESKGPDHPVCPCTITKTRLYNFDPFKPHFYIVKLGFTGVYIIFLISAQKHRPRF